MAEHDYVDRAGEITVQQLIRHTSGIPDFAESGKFDVFDFTTSYQPIDLVKAARTGMATTPTPRAGHATSTGSTPPPPPKERSPPRTTSAPSTAH
ncbi:hypothetical protein [Nonomuraea sp. NEAU-A123]|uniref:hypothetical protein n=1 Tax=Nonomuraea sp. NEAU-A123 TaxID=2839649 RepID=UPI001BE48C30|nr:hypothetical protein [Nonomuraea sp. NEAU-A123]MBT2227761.1 hypothetical protein [Nonomuraea sp. NEAU-A123]